jgi:integrase/recombinase XerD
MTQLRRQMIENMRLHGLAESTQRSYVRVVRALVKYYMRPPDEISEAEIRQFFLYLTQTRRLDSSTVTVYLHGIKFFYEKTLRRQWPIFDLLRVKRSKKLPAVLSRDEVRELLRRVRTPAARMSLTLMYCCGLRVSEALRLRPTDIDGSRRVLCVRNGKGRKDRYVPLPVRALQRLRAYWRANRPQGWLFPSGQGGGPMTAHFVRSCLRAALAETKIRKKVSCHTLRHSYATHLLEQGVNVRAIQALLGHKSIRTTCRYLHLTATALRAVRQSVEELAAGL